MLTSKTGTPSRKARRRSRFAAAGAGLGLLTLLPASAFPCTCAPGSIPNTIKNADAILSGRVVHMELMDEPVGGRHVARMELRVYRQWRGLVGARTVLFTACPDPGEFERVPVVVEVAPYRDSIRQADP